MNFKFHKAAAVFVLVAFGLWMGTGKFSAVGSAAAEADAAAKKAQAETPVTPLRTVSVLEPTRVQHQRAIRLSGLTEADKRSVLATRVGGIIGQLPVKQGDRVKMGDMILLLNAEEKTALVATARQVLEQRQAEFEAMERLGRSGNVAKLQIDNARSALATGRSLLEAAEAELARNEVKAPFDGVVDRISVQLGSAIMSGTEVATVLALNPIIARGEISERDLDYVEIGDKAEALLVNGTTVEGTIRYISRDATANTRTFRIEVAIPNADFKIPSGMTAELTLRTQPTDSVLLPRSVVTLSTSGDLGIRAVDKDSKVMFIPIDIVDDTSKGIVLGGVPAGVKVIVAGQDLVSDGDKVNAVQADEETVRKLVGEVTGSTKIGDVLPSDGK